MSQARDTAERIFEAFLERASDPEMAIEQLLVDHEEHATHLRSLWAGYRRIVAMLGTPEESPTSTPQRGRYEVRGEIGSGGMGSVLEVWDAELRRMLAMKVLREDGHAGAVPSARARSRLINEAQILGQLEHPGIVPIHEVGEDDAGRPYFTMLRVRGRALDEVFDDARAERSGWNLTRALTALLRASEAIAHAHDRGVLHRDLKPANVMVGPFGEVYVMDWGLAKARGMTDTAADLRWTDSQAITESSNDEQESSASIWTDRRAESSDAPESPILTMDGDVVGTPSYMAPEQAEGRIHDVDERADVYSLGAMLYRLLSGAAPYISTDTSSTPRQVLAAVLDGSPEPLEKISPSRIPGELAAVCARAMARDRHARYPSIRDLANDLRAYLEGRVVKAYRTGPVVELSKWVRRNKAVASAVAAVIMAILGAVAIQYRANQRVSERAEDLRRQVYNNDIAFAQIAHSRNDTAAMRSLLDKCPEDLRDWEWHCLQRMVDTSSVRFPAGGSSCPSPDGQQLVVGGLRQGSGLAVFDLQDGQPRGRIEDRAFIRSIRSASTGSMFVGSNEGRLLVCDPSKSKLVREVSCGASGRRGVIAIPSPDGKLLALARDSGELELWSTAPPTFIRRLDSGIRSFHDASWSADGQLLAAAAWDHERNQGQRDSALRIYDVRTGALRHRLPGHTNWIYSVSTSPDGRWVATGGRDNRVLLWDLTADPVQPRQLGPPLSDIPRVAWTPDGARLLTTGESRVQVWNPNSWTIEQSLVGLESEILSVNALADSRVIASDRSSSRVWQLSRRERITERSVRGAPSSIAFSPDGSEFAIGFPAGPLEVWSTHERRCLRVLEIQCNRTRLAYTNNERLLTLDESGHLRLHDATTGADVRSVHAHASGSLFDLAIHPHLESVATCGQDRRVRLWDLETLEHRWTIEEGLSSTWPQGVHSVSFSPSGDRLVVGTADGILRVLASVNGHVLQELRASPKRLRYRDPVFSPDGKSVVALVVGDSSRLVAWNTDTGAKRWDVLAEVDGEWPSFTADGLRVLTATKGGALAIREAVSGRRIVTLEHGAPSKARAMAVSHDRTTVVIGSTDNRLRFWSREPWTQVSTKPPPSFLGLQLAPPAGTVATRTYWIALANVQRAIASGQPKPEIERLLNACDPLRRGFEWRYLAKSLDNRQKRFRAHTAPIGALQVSPNGNLLATVGATPFAALWDRKTGRPHGIIEDGADATSCAFSPSGARLAIASRDGSLIVWDVAEVAQPPRTLEGHTTAITSCCWLDNNRLASGGQDRVIRIWDVARGTQIDSIRLSAPVERVAASPQRSLLAVTLGGVDRIFLFDSESFARIDPFGPRRRRCTLLQFGLDGTQIAAGFLDGSLHSCEVDTGAILQNHSVAIRCPVAALSLDSRYLATGSEALVRVSDRAVDGKVVAQVPCATPPTGLAFGPNGRVLYVGHEDGTVTVSDTRRPAILREFTGTPEPISRVAVGASNRSLAAQTINGSIYIWQIDQPNSPRIASGSSSEARRWFPTPARSRDRATGSGRTFITGTDNRIHLVDAADGTELGSLRAGSNLSCVAVSADGDVLVAGSTDTVFAWILQD